MKTLYDYAVKAHKEGTDFFGEEPRENARAEATLHYEVEHTDKPHFRMAIPMQGTKDGKVYQCGTGVGIYPYVNDEGTPCFYFFSGSRVFDIEVTPEITIELQQAQIEYYKVKVQRVEQNARLKEVEHLIASACVARDNLQVDIDAHDHYVKTGKYPRGYDGTECACACDYCNGKTTDVSVCPIMR